MTDSEVSRTQIDRLGDRLRRGDPADEDLILLDEFRRSYSRGYERVIAVIRERLGIEPTGRPAKSTNAIVEKLRRETVRLSQMQDIAGCRFVVPSVAEQDAAVRILLDAFGRGEVDDRRERPSHGYRAVHFVVVEGGVPIEVQIRAALQHSWAELSEKHSDMEDPAVKYGGGPQRTRDLLSGFSQLIAMLERAELDQGERARMDLERVKRSTGALLRKAIDDLERREEGS